MTSTLLKARSTRMRPIFNESALDLSTGRLNDYRAFRSNPVINVDPLGLQSTTTQPATQPGTATVDLEIITGSDNKQSPWIGATWTTYYGVKGDKGNLGLIRPGPVKVKCSCDGGCGIKCIASFSLQMQLRNADNKQVIKNTNGKRVLTDFGRQVYGHEQMHIKDYVTQARALVNSIADNTPNGKNPADCKKRAADAERHLRKALSDFLEARKPGARPDVTHGGTGQPVSGVGSNPEGEPGPWVPSR